MCLVPKVVGTDVDLPGPFDPAATLTDLQLGKFLGVAERSKDVLIVQGGLHQLSSLPDDLDQAFSEMRRVVRKNGRAIFVEPWRTPFLDFVHFVSEISVVRRLSAKMDAFATMVENEIRTYKQWLDQPELIRKVAHAHFVPVRESMAWGKWNFVGAPR